MSQQKQAHKNKAGTCQTATNADTVNNLIALLITSASAPVISHCLSLVFGEDANLWTTDRILILIFSSLAGLVLADGFKHLPIFSSARHPHIAKGLRLGDFDLITSIIWALPVITVCLFFDSFFCAVLLSCYLILSVIILFTGTKFNFDYPSFIRILLASAAVAALFPLLLSIPVLAEAFISIGSSGYFVKLILAFILICSLTTLFRYFSERVKSVKEKRRQ